MKRGCSPGVSSRHSHAWLVETLPFNFKPFPSRTAHRARGHKDSKLENMR